MPLTALGGSTGTVTVGDVTLGLFPQPLHPNVMAYVAAQTANSYSPTRAMVDALNNLTWGLVGMGLWDKMDVIYPFLGGTTLNAHKWNLKDVRDADAAFRLTQTGTSFTYSDNGVQSTITVNSATQHLKTYYDPTSNVASTSSVHLSVYVNSQSTINGGCLMGSITGTTSAYQIIRTLSATGNPIAGNPHITNTSFISFGSNTTGFYCATRTGATTSAVYKNGLSALTSTAALSATANQVYLFNRYNGTTANASANGRFAFVSMGDGLSAQENLDLYNLVQTYQTALSRQV
jgi:hypothetical protein